MNAPLPQYLSDAAREEMAEEAFTSVFPNGLPDARPAATSAIARGFPLDEAHVVALVQSKAEGEVLGVTPAPLRRISRTHHRLAQLLATGMDEGQAGMLCGFAASTVSILKSDPMFRETMALYESQTDAAFVEVLEQMKDLHLDVVHEIRDRMAALGDKAPLRELTELFKAVSDRVGFGPSSSSRSENVSVTLSGADIARIKSTHAGPTLTSYGVPHDATPANAALGDGRSARVLSEADRLLVEGHINSSARIVAGNEGEEGDAQGGGAGLREEDGGAADEDVADPHLPPVDTVE